MADLIVLGAAFAIGACGGPQIPVRGGRIDATGPGAVGVPKPETDLKTTLADFSRAGFSQEDAIGLTACGHSMGGVHYSTFPDVVPESSVGPNNTDGRVAFDDTVANFDVNNIQQYVSGTGNRGGPLVTSANMTVRSDLRLFSSDRNATVQRLAKSPNLFRSTCTNLVTRMSNTVPKGVTLTPLINPEGVKYANLTLNVGWSGELTLSGFLRYIENSGSASAPDSLTVTIVDRDHRPTRNSVQAINDHLDHSNGIYGPTFHYPFTISFAGSSGLSGIRVGDQNFQLQDSLFVVPTMSSIDPGLATFNIIDPTHEITFNITAAVSLDITFRCYLCIFLTGPNYSAPNFQPSTNIERNYCNPGTPTWEHKSEDGLLYHGAARLYRQSWPVCVVFSHTCPEFDVATTFW